MAQQQQRPTANENGKKRAFVFTELSTARYRIITIELAVGHAVGAAQEGALGDPSWEIGAAFAGS